MLGFVGVTSIETSTASVTVSVVFDDILPRVAVIVVAPTPVAVATPSEMVATPASDELQVTLVVRSWCVLSLRMPVAVRS
jgi:hypothetical protein